MIDHAEVTEDTREESRVDQVQDRVLDSAAVEIDRQPVLQRRRVERHLVVTGIRESVEVPGRVDERIHRVRLPARRTAALRTRHVDEFGYLSEWRVAAAGELRKLRQFHRELIVWHRDDPVLLA